jgi:hypothetical protein
MTALGTKESPTSNTPMTPSARIEVAQSSLTPDVITKPEPLLAMPHGAQPRAPITCKVPSSIELSHVTALAKYGSSAPLSAPAGMKGVGG